MALQPRPLSTFGNTGEFGDVAVATVTLSKGSL
jgi:hypothetical protein